MWARHPHVFMSPCLHVPMLQCPLEGIRAEGLSPAQGVQRYEALGHGEDARGEWRETAG